MKRRLRRAIIRHTDEVDRFILARVREELDRQKIDYTIIDGEIMTPRKKEVQDIYDNIRLNAFTAFTHAEGDMGRFRRLYAGLYK